MIKIIIYSLAFFSTYAFSQKTQEDGVLGGINIPSLSSAECMAIKYKPIDIYLSPGSPKVGQLILNRPEIARKDASSCDERPIIQSHINKQANNIYTMEISYEHAVPAVYEVKVINKTTWLKLKNQTQDIWIKKDNVWPYLTYEKDLIQGIQIVEEICDTNKKCTQLPPSLQEQATNLDREDNCYGNLYDLNGAIIKLPDGRKAYKVKMADSLTDKFKNSLPIEGYIPIYTKNKEWSGFFYSRGC